MAFNSVYVHSPQQPYPTAQKELERMRPSSLTRACSVQKFSLISVPC